MRAVGVHQDVVVLTSRAFQTNAALVRSGDEAFLVDSPVFPDELDVVGAVAEQAGFQVVGCLATHGDWDHLLGRFAFPEAPLAVAESTLARMERAPGAVQRELRTWDEQLYVERPGPLTLPAPQAVPPGYLALGDAELELHEATGHTEDGVAVWVPWASVLLCGDYLSPVEVPMVSAGGSAAAYLATLDRLEPLVDAAAFVVPGHGEVLDGTRAAAILREDRAYVAALLDRGADAPLPLARRTGEQQRIHAENAARVAASG